MMYVYCFARHLRVPMRGSKGSFVIKGPVNPRIALLLCGPSSRVAMGRRPTGSPEAQWQIRAGMTLVELLVVVGIISVLGAMLMPVLGRGRSQAHAIICVSNLRQLYLANTMYARENNGHYVRAAPDINEGYGGRVRWHGVRNTPDGESDFDPKRGPLFEYLPDARVKECPVFFEFRTREEISQAFESGTGGYGYNMRYVGATHHIYDWEEAPETAIRASRIEDPSRTIMFADAALPVEEGLIEYGFLEAPHFVTPDNPQGNEDWGYASPSLHFRHYGRVNVVWCDGHVTCEKKDWAPDTNFYGANNHRSKVGWFGPKNNYYFDVGSKDNYLIVTKEKPDEEGAGIK